MNGRPHLSPQDLDLSRRERFFRQSLKDQYGNARQVGPTTIKRCCAAPGCFSEALPGTDACPSHSNRPST